MAYQRLLLLVTCVIGVGAPLWAQNIERRELASGLTVITCELATSHAVEVRVLVRAAPLHEGVLMGSGLSHLLQRMIAANATGPEAAAIIRRLGNGLRAETTPVVATYAIKTVDTQLDEALALLAGLVGAPSLTAENLDLARKQQLADLADQDKDWQIIQDRLLRKSIFVNHPARLPVDGQRQALEALTLDAVQAFHRQRYHTGSTTVIVAGNIGAEGAVARVAKAFTAYPQGVHPLPVRVDEPVQYQARGLRREVSFIGNHRHAYAWRTASFEHRDQLALDLIAIILANPDLVDLSRRLTNRLLVTDFMVANRRSPGRSGYFVIGYSPAIKRNIDAWEEVAATLTTLRTTGPSENALAAAKHHWLREYRMAKLNTSLIAADIADWELADVDPGYREEMANLIKAITIADIIQVADRYLHENGRNKHTVILEPPAHAGNGNTVLPIPISDARPVRVDYDNQAILLKQQMPSLGLTFLRVSIGGGIAIEQAKELGAIKILAALLAKGPVGLETSTEMEREAAFRQMLANRGMQFNAYATRHSLELVVTCFPKDIDEAMALLIDTLKTPALPPVEFDHLLQSAKADLAGLVNRNWEGRLRTKIHESLFVGHYAAQSGSGSEESLAGLDRDALVALHHRLVVGANLVMTIYGQYERPSLDDILAGLFARDPDLKVGARAQIRGTPWPEDLAQKTISLGSEDGRRGLAIVWKAPALEDQDTNGPAMDVLEAVLLGADGQGGRIGERLGKSFAISILDERYMGRGIWGLLVETPPKRMEEVRKLVLDQVEQFLGQLAAEATGPEAEVLDQELENARVLCASRHLLADENHCATAARHAQALLLGQTLDSEIVYGRALRQVDRASLITVARAYLSQPLLTVQLVTPEGAPPTEPPVDRNPE